MRCVVCKYDYCWTCGSSLDNTLHKIFFEAICQVWEEANIKARRQKQKNNKSFCWIFCYVLYLLAFILLPPCYYVGLLVYFCTIGLVHGPYYIGKKLCRLSTKENILLFFPNLILYLLLGSLAIPSGLVALVFYYITLIVFFLRLSCRSCCSFRSITGSNKYFEKQTF